MIMMMVLVCLSICLVSAILMKLYTVVVYDWRMCMKENNPIKTTTWSVRKNGLYSGVVLLLS